MGGLVAWSWKNLYYQKGHYDFYLACLLLLSAPLQGSCEMLRMLLMGYRPIPGGSHETSYKFLFDYLLPAAYTFPSLFQLLPQFDRNPQKHCLVFKSESEERAADHFSVNTWDRILLSNLTGSKLIPSWVPFLGSGAVWSDLGLSPAEFLVRLESQLEKGKRFRQSANFRLRFIQATAAEAGRSTGMVIGQTWVRRTGRSR